MSRFERLKERLKEFASKTRTYVSNLENPLRDRRIHFETKEAIDNKDHANDNNASYKNENEAIIKK